MQKITALILLVLLGGLTLCFAQLPTPVWVKKIKLSGLSGPANQRLAIINGKTFSQGEYKEIKVAGTVVSVQCLEIRESSVLIQIQDLPDPCELTLSGDMKDEAAQPEMTSTSQPVADVKPSMPAPVQPFKSFFSSEPTNHRQSAINGKTFSPLFFAGIFVALVVGIAIGAGAGYQLHRKNIGEAMLAETISRQFDHPHHLLNNITLPTPEGTTQIDHVLVADTGIFVIESKHYSGWIFGDPKERQWTEAIYQKKSPFQNPLHQNYGHVKALQSLFNLPEDHFHSVVVFTANAAFKTNLGPNVIHLAELVPFLTAKRPALFDERKMAYVIGRIEMIRKRRSVETDEYHINHVRRRISGKFNR